MIETLLAIALSMGVTYVVEEIEKAKMSKAKLTSEKLNQWVNAILAKGKTKGNSVYNKILNKLNDIPYIPGVGDEVRKTLFKEKQRLSKLRDDVQDNLSRAENYANNAASAAGAYSYLSDREKLKIDKEGSEANLLKGMAETNANKANEYYNQIQNVERKI